MTHWYGWKIALSDAVAWGAMIAAQTNATEAELEADPEANVPGLLLFAGGALWFELATPLVHLTERNAAGAATSLGLRLGLPLVGALVGSAFDRESSPDDYNAGVGLVVGAIAASAIDIAYVARKETRASTLWPQVMAGSQGFRIGMGGTL